MWTTAFYFVITPSINIQHIINKLTNKKNLYEIFVNIKLINGKYLHFEILLTIGFNTHCPFDRSISQFDS